MRIALITETFLPATDGVVTRLCHTIEELRDIGDELLIVAPKYGEGPSTFAGVPIHRVSGVPFPPYPQIKLSPPNPGVGRALGQFRPDLLHAVNPFILGMGVPYYARRLEVPLVASYHTNVAAYTRFYGLGFFYKATRWYTKKLHNQAAINLCTSEATREYLTSEGIERVRLWPQGVDARRFHPDKFSKDWRVRLSGGHPAERLVLYVGRLAPEKEIGRLKVLLRKLAGTRLAIVGDGPARGDLEREFEGTPTVFTGMLQDEDLAAAFASADVFLFPSTTETLGMAMIEALASGLPVVAAESGASREVVSDGENGLLYNSDEALVSTVGKLLDDEALRFRLADRAREAALERDWASSTRTLRSYYQEALREEAVR